jgi:hypothetical protein
MYTVEAAKTVFKRFRKNPRNYVVLDWKDVSKKCPLKSIHLNKINEYLARVGLEISEDEENQGDIILFELNKFPSNYYCD